MNASFDLVIILSAAAAIVCLIALSGVRIATFLKILPDNPNWRSSHSRATSRGGGIAIFSAWLAGLVFIATFSGWPEAANVSLKFAAAALFAFLIGLADDRWTLSPVLKFGGQIAAAIAFIVLLGPLATAPLPLVGDVTLGGFGIVITIFWIVCFMNAFNFMDGVNGIAGGVAVVGLSALSFVAAFYGAAPAGVVAMLLGVACFGFLPANLLRGRLFMGDSGSHTLGFVVAGLGVYMATESGGSISALTAPMIFLPFIFDVAWTLTHRVARRRNILTGHREHLYQLMNQLGQSHFKVAAIYALLTIFCAAVAIYMQTLAPAIQWAAPAGVLLAFLAGAITIHRKAVRAGLLRADQDARETDVVTNSASAAE